MLLLLLCWHIYIHICICINRWCEVELLLRKRITNDDDLEQTLVAAEAGIQFMTDVSIVY